MWVVSFKYSHGGSTPTSWPRQGCFLHDAWQFVVWTRLDVCLHAGICHAMTLRYTASPAVAQQGGDALCNLK
jgi:hypothetical protein